jgi:membrane fusion protein, multidrug efflux system
MSATQEPTTAKHWLRRSIFWAVVVICLVALLVRCSHQRSSGASENRRGDSGRPVAVVAATATQGDLPIYQDALGTVIPSNNVLVRSRVDGQLMHLRFTEGQTVKAGDVLAEIDPRSFQVQLQQAQGQLTRDEALLSNARIDLGRDQILWQQDSISKQEMDTQQALVHQYEGAVQTDRAAVANAQLQLSYATITAPISGRVGLRQVDPGNMVYASDANGLVLITQVQPINAVFTIPEAQLGAVLTQLQQRKTLSVEAWDRQRSKVLASGKLLTADNQIDITTGTVKLKAQFENNDGLLFPNQFINIRMHVDTVQGAVLIPANAVQRGSQGIFVYTVAADKTVKLQLVTLGETTGEQVVVSSGLAAGTQVVVDGVDKLREGAAVELIDPNRKDDLNSDASEKTGDTNTTKPQRHKSE